MLLVDRLNPWREEVGLHLRLGGVDRLVALLLLRDRVGSAQVGFHQSEHVLLDRRMIRSDEFARLLRRLFGEADDGVDHRLKVPMAEHHRAEHDLLGQLTRFRFHHQYRVMGAGHHEVELALQHLVDLRIEDEFVVDETDARGADRSHERHA